MITHNIYSHEEIGEPLVLNTHNICFHGEIRKLFT